MATSVVGMAVGAPAGGAAVYGPGAVAMTLDVNGAARKISVEPRTTLLDALRDEFGLTGAKPAGFAGISEGPGPCARGPVIGR